MNTCDTKPSLFDELSPAQQGAVMRWIRGNLAPRASPLMSTTSYGLKHLMTSATGIYVTNDQFKEAMQRAGYKPINQQDLNWSFCISRKSPAFMAYREVNRWAQR